jgi:hypothetical protein
MDLSKLIKSGRVEPILEDRGEYQMVVGYRRPAKSRKRGSWTLREPRPYQVPQCVLRKTKGAELVADAHKREELLADKYERAAPGQLFASAKCYADLAMKLEAGAPFEATAAEVAKAWPWDSSLWTPTADVVALYAKAGGMFWIEADCLKAFGDTGEPFVRACYAADVCAKEIDRVLIKPEAEPAAEKGAAA